LAKIARYVEICNKNPVQVKFLKGWLNKPDLTVEASSQQSEKLSGQVEVSVACSHERFLVQFIPISYYRLWNTITLQ
jgi:hypothetical protein